MNKIAFFKYVLAFFVLIWVQKAQAQKADKIYIIDGSVIAVKVVSTKGDSVFYRAYFASFQKKLFGVPKVRIDRIVYKNDDIEIYGGKPIKYMPRDENLKRDIIYRKDGSELSVIVVSTTKDSIYYRPYFKNENKIIFGMRKEDVYMISYKNGLLEDVSEQSVEYTRFVKERLRLLDEQNKRTRDSIKIILDKKKNIIKFSPFTFVVNYAVLGYERSLGKGQSAEIKLGIIGINQDKYDLPANGAFGSLAYKIILKPAERPKKPRNLLHGLYLRPELAFGSYKQTYTHETFRGSNQTPEIETAKHAVSYRCFVVNVGKQWVAEQFVFDLFAGVGLGSYNQSAESFGIVDRTRYSYRMDMDSIKNSGDVKFKIGFYIGFNF